jgi:hypothetical protein
VYVYAYAYAYVCVLMHYMCADAECVADCDADCVAGSDVIRSSVLKKSKEVKNRFLTYWSLSTANTALPVLKLLQQTQTSFSTA